jgi:hypothetical protein
MPHPTSISHVLLFLTGDSYVAVDVTGQSETLTDRALMVVAARCEGRGATDVSPVSIRIRPPPDVVERGIALRL